MATLTSQLILSLIDKVTGPARGIGGALGRLDNQIDRLNRNNRAMIAPMGGFAGRLLAYGAGYIGVTKGIEGTVGAALTFEAALSDVRKVVDVNDQQFANMKRDIIGLSKVMPTSAEGFASIYAAAAQSGIAQSELKGFAEGVVRVSTAWDTAVEVTGESLAKIKTALGRDIPSTMALADAINHVSNVSAASAPDMLEYTNRVAAFAETAGFSAEQALAFGGAMVGSGFEPEVAATSFRNMSRALTMGTRATKAQRVAFKSLGLDATKTAKNMQKNAVETTLDVLDRIKKLPEFQQISIAGALFGEEARALSPLFRNADELRRLLRETGDSATYAGSAFKEYTVRAGTVGNVLSILKNKVSDVFRGIGDDMLPSIKEASLGIGYVLDTLGSRASVFDKLGTSVRGFAQGLGYEGGIREAVEGLGDLLFGKVDGSGAADQLGQLFVQAEGWGKSIRELNDALKDNPIAQFAGQIGAEGFKLAMAAVGIGLLAGAVRKLAGAMYFLSGAKAAVGILAMLAKGGKWAAAAAGILTAAEAVDTAGGKPKGAPKPNGKPPVPKFPFDPTDAAAAAAGIGAVAAGILGAVSAGLLNLGQSDAVKTDAELERNRKIDQGIRDRFQYPDATHDEDHERDRSVDQWAPQPRAGGIRDVLNPPDATAQRTDFTSAFQRMLDGMAAIEAKRTMPAHDQDSGTVVPTGDWRAPAYEPDRTRGGHSDVRPMPTGPVTPSAGAFGEFQRMLDGMSAPAASAPPAIPIAPPVDVAAKLQSIIMQTRSTGVSEVHMTNPPPPPPRPNVSVSVTVNNTQGDPGAIGAAVGERVKSAVESTYSDGGM